MFLEDLKMSESQNEVDFTYELGNHLTTKNIQKQLLIAINRSNLFLIFDIKIEVKFNSHFVWNFDEILEEF